MTPLVASLITALVTFVLTAAGTYITTRRNLQLQFDASLRDLRIEAYKELWKHLKALAKYGRAEPLSKSESQQLAKDLRIWYFETGGFYLSQETRHDYFALLDGLEVVTTGAEPILEVGDDEFLRVLGSRLRTGMTRDVGTRRTFIFRGDTERGTRLPQARTYVEEGGSRRLAISPRRRIRLPRRLSLPGVGAVISAEPTLDVEGFSELVHWDPARRAISARLFDSEADGVAEERLFLIEEGHVVEGPRGWRRGERAGQRRSVIWREDESNGVL